MDTKLNLKQSLFAGLSAGIAATIINAFLETIVILESSEEKVY